MAGLSPEQAARLVARAGGLDARMVASAGECDPELAERRLDIWARACCRGDRAALARRLAAEGWDLDGAQRALGAPPPAEPASRWLEPLAAALARGEEIAAELRRGPLPEEALFPPGRRLPFLHLFAGFLREGRERLAAKAGSAALAGLAPSARDDLARRLLNDLVLWSGAALTPGFARSLTLRRLPRRQDSDAGYRAFVLAHLEGGLAGLLADHATLGRQLGTLLATWVESSAELVGRLAADRPLLAPLFPELDPTAPATRLDTARSDRHRGGRSVAILELGGGRLVYKPRPVDLELGWHRLLGWLSARGAALPRPLRVLARPGYGWMEWVAPGELADDEAAADYFRRAGGIVALAWLLGATDLHAENVVAAADGPHLVDLETLLQPPAAAEVAAVEPFAPSQLLGSRHRDPAGRPFDFGGLSGGGGALGELRRPVWRHACTDAQALEAAPAALAEPGNRPSFRGRRLVPADRAADLAAGYAHTYEALLGHREALRAPDGPLAALRATEPRVLLRPSQVYGALLARLRTPRLQREGVLGDLLIDALNRALHPFAQPSPVWRLAAAERRALRGLDVPVFTAGATNRTVTADDGSRAELFPRSGWDGLADRLTGLDPVERDRHLELLARQLDARPRGLPPPDALEVSLIAAAVEIGRTLGARAERHPESWWLPPGCPAGTPPSPHLYDGAPGIALFLAALARVTGEAWAAELATRALRLPLPEAAAPPLGACTGVGGRVYALVGTARLLDDDHWLDVAAAAAGAIRGTAATGGAWDLAAGRAGALLGLLALAPHRPSAALDETVTAVAHALPGAAGSRPAGLAHGLSGVALALARFSSHAGDPGAAETAARLLAEEQVAPHIARLGRTEMALSWCQGAAGMALARLALPDDAGRSRQIDSALRANLESGLGSLDHICCGTGGRIELVLQAASVRSDAGLLATAREAGRLWLERLAAQPSTEGDPMSPDPTLFRGIAGIGYQLLRLARPSDLPSLLTFEGFR